MSAIRRFATTSQSRSPLLSAALAACVALPCLGLAQKAGKPRAATELHDIFNDQVVASPDGRFVLIGTFAAADSEFVAHTFTGGEFRLEAQIKGVFSADEDDAIDTIIESRVIPDVLEIIASWGMCAALEVRAGVCAADIDGDGIVGPGDLVATLQQFRRP